MPYAIDLNSRQSVRTLEQAIRHGAEVLIEPRIWPDGEPIPCRMQPPSVAGSRAALACRIMAAADAPSASREAQAVLANEAAFTAMLARIDALVGTYCDLAIRLGDHLYLCSCDVLRIEKPAAADHHPMIHLTRPETIQVTQRRRFHRISLADSTKIRLHWIRSDDTADEGTGWICNISADGLACRVDAHVADRLWIGEQIQVNFALSPTDTQRFMLEATICSKTPTGTEGKVMIGVQFLTGPSHQYSTQAVESLRRRLLSRHLLTSRPAKEEGL
ncbi:MAG TPA: PilZ domain-containing protein [Phycisphaerae bacterium]|nr:PilZ domain-containing protein [Phycisphaerae bacterium]HRY66979.1 PilZ domain-containing protein [Phycisphaerae bacterium]HSA29555.1 PilZ domain-containing protein [Phycisphaerae bacterium]